MANYTKATNFAAKDSLPSGNSGKIVKGTEIDTEFNAIASAIASKTDSNSPAFTGTPTAPTPSAGNDSTQLATTAFVNTAITNERSTTATLTNKTLSNATISSLSSPLAVAAGGTGTATPSLVAGTNITISGSFPNQTINATPSGVTSLNGQTGAITNTNFNAIGSYLAASNWNGNTATSDFNSTYAGSNFRIQINSPFQMTNNYQSGITFNPNATGTWRALGRSQNNEVEPGLFDSFANLWVRIS